MIETAVTQTPPAPPIAPRGVDSTILSRGSVDTAIYEPELRALIHDAFQRMGSYRKIAIVPPDHTRLPSQAGLLTRVAVEHYGSAVQDIIPALGTHKQMSVHSREQLFGRDLDKRLIRVHHCTERVRTLDTLDRERMTVITEGIWNEPLPVQLNEVLADGDHDLLLSIGQVMPHEVAGIANQLKNILVGVGGKEFIDASHWVGACTGIEKVMGRSDNPVRNVFRAAGEMLAHKNIVYVLTVRGPARPDETPDNYGLVTRGIYMGQGQGVFEEAAKLAMQVNFIPLEREIRNAVVYLDPEEFSSTWLGNKAIYRIRLALADHAVLKVIGPAVREFGELPAIDALIRRYGYKGTPAIMEAVKRDPELRSNLSAAAHLIHGSSEGRFKVIWCPGGLSREEVTSAGFEFGDCAEELMRYDPCKLKFGENIVDGEEIFFVPNPAQVLLAAKSRLKSW